VHEKMVHSGPSYVVIIVMENALYVTLTKCHRVWAIELLTQLRTIGMEMVNDMPIIPMLDVFSLSNLMMTHSFVSISLPIGTAFSTSGKPFFKIPIIAFKLVLSCL
jgi:hypothetical protein